MAYGAFGPRGESPLRQSIRRSMAVQGLSPAHAGYFQRQDRGLNLQPAGLPIAIIDGPFDTTALSKILARTPVSAANGSCRTDANGACSHGTFIMGMIGASRDAPIPGLCPECQLVHVQLFVDEEAPHASIAQLADAITAAVAAGAKLINLSLPLPPMLDRESFLAELDRIVAASAAPTLPTSHGETIYLKLQGKTIMVVGNGLPRNDAPAPAATSTRTVTPACMCGAPGGNCTCGDAGPSHYVYVLGTVDVRFPDQSIPAEFQELADAMPNGQQGVNEERRDWCYRILSATPRQYTRYIARQLCWILYVEGQPAYYLILRDMQDFDGLIDCLGEPKNDDLCLFVGSSPLQVVELCHGIKAPVLTVDQVYRYKKSNILQHFKAKKGGPNPDELYKELFQSADNFGHTDEWRALNFLAVRYPPLCRWCYNMVQKKYDLKAFPVLTSRLAAWGTKRIVDAIFTFDKRGDTRKYFVRVDVTHLFPMVVAPIAKYVDRVTL
jgi:PatG C-terminal